MTDREVEALRVHNNLFSIQAKFLLRLSHLGLSRWHVIYSDGHIKSDYECGDAAKQITEVLMRGLS